MSIVALLMESSALVAASWTLRGRRLALARVRGIGKGRPHS